MSFAEVERAIDAAVGRRVFPGAVLLVRDGDRLFYRRAFGHRSLEPMETPMCEDTVFDIASLTKAVATSVAMMVMVRDGRIALDDRISRFFHNFGGLGKTHITFRHLLSHSSGLPAWRPFYTDILHFERRSGRVNFLGSPEAKEYVYQQITREKVDVPPGTRSEYSDLGFMMIGAAIEAVASTTLDRFCQARIFRPLGLHATGFVNLALMRAHRLEAVTDRIAPTENCPWRHKIVCGEVHDDNAYAMGGVAGHAGLFSTADDLDLLVCHLKDCYYRRAVKPLVPAEIVRELWKIDGSVPGSTWALGWDTPSPVGSSAGSKFARHAVGHLGFTGCSLWIDLEHDRHVLLLTNRVHPSRNNDLIRDFRPYIHDLITEAIEASAKGN
ncbi:MAG TPA: serine hydrolase domain-containing protein [Terriglobales bacterium]|nr:serine hydrolase domain-containing protein [Terriglobales bacterium]